MRRTLAILTLLIMAPAAQAQGGLTDLFRSVTGALRGGAEPAPRPQGGAVLGVRGMDEGGAQAAAGPAGDDYALVEGWAATRPEALAAAERRGLAARRAVLTEAAPEAAKQQ